MRGKTYLYIYATTVFAGLASVSIASAQSIAFTGNISGPANFMDGIREVHVSGDYAFVVAVHDDAFNVVDVSNSASPFIAVSIGGFHCTPFHSQS